MHNVIVDLHKSLFALPIAFIFAATRIDPHTAYSLSNTIILVCSWIAVFLFFLSLASHWKTLNFVCKEIETQKENASRYTDLADRLMPPYNELINRCAFQRGLMKWLGAALLIVFTTLTGLYLYSGVSSPKSQDVSTDSLSSKSYIYIPQCESGILIFDRRDNCLPSHSLLPDQQVTKE